MKVKALKYDLESQPGWITFSFEDAYSKTWQITEKLPVLGLEFPEDESNVPFEFEAPISELEQYVDKEGKLVCRIRFLYNIETQNGVKEFEIFK